MLSKFEEDKLIEDGSAKIENIISATSIEDVYNKFKECTSRLQELGLHTFDEISQEDFTDPEENEVEFILPLSIQPTVEGDDGETELCLVFNYILENGLYSIFADVDFFLDETNEILKIQE
jgi:hypothetical protein